MFRVCFVFSLSLGLVYSVPANYVKLATLVTGNENIGSSDQSINTIQNSERRLLETDNAVDTQVQQYHNIIRLSDSEATDIIIDAPVHAPCNQDGVKGVLAIDYDSLNEKQLPLWPDEYPQSNQVYEDQEPVKITMDIDDNNYDDDDNELTSPVLLLEYFPKIYSTYVEEETVPFLEDSGNNAIDVLGDEHNAVQETNSRPNRSEDEEYARIMAQLEHDAMLNNILPTMSYVRGAEKYEVQPVLQTAIFENRIPSGCGLPILLGCQPNLSGGVLINSN